MRRTAPSTNRQADAAAATSTELAIFLAIRNTIQMTESTGFTKPRALENDHRFTLC